MDFAEAYKALKDELAATQKTATWCRDELARMESIRFTLLVLEKREVEIKEKILNMYKEKKEADEAARKRKEEESEEEDIYTDEENENSVYVSLAPKPGPSGQSSSDYNQEYARFVVCSGGTYRHVGLIREDLGVFGGDFASRGDGRGGGFASRGDGRGGGFASRGGGRGAGFASRGGGRGGAFASRGGGHGGGYAYPGTFF
uniref:Uncharacterized protein n=1 Tax=Panagrolaimus sp. PS1159 TaxID=55785 RepID=A0AC35F839_9BILA